LTGVPATWSPTTTQIIPIHNAIDNGTGTTNHTSAMISSSGTITLYLNYTPNGWTASGTKDAAGTGYNPITYLLQ
jgi:hypothetical protein